MTSQPPSILFVPASGASGCGEYYRCLTLARMLRRESPQTGIGFVLHRNADVELDRRFVYHRVSDTPARAVGEVAALLDELRPGLVVFDSSGRVRHMRQARRQGAAVTWISDRPGKRFKAFRPHHMRQLDLHLIVDTRTNRRLKLHEKLLSLFSPRTRIRLVAGIVDLPLEKLLTEKHEMLARADRPYAVFVAGGGGYMHQGRPVPDILVDAAARLARHSGIESVVVTGPQYRGGITSHPEVKIIDSLPTAALGALLGNAHIAVTGAGTMLAAQVLSAPVPVVMVPAGGHDQPRRIRCFVRSGLVHSAPLEPDKIFEQAKNLLESRDARRAMVSRQRRHCLATATLKAADFLLQLGQRSVPAG